MACSALLQTTATRQACTGLYGQHCDHCIHQPPRRSTLPSHVATPLPSPPLKLSSIVQTMSSHVSPPFRENGDSTLRCPADWEMLWRRSGRPVCLPNTSHYQLFFYLSEGTLGTDALELSWPLGLRKYAFPPVSLLAQTLCKVREDEEQVLLVAPYWPNRTCFPELMLLVKAPPWQIPLRRDLLS